MHILSPTTLFSCPPKPQQTSQLKTAQPSSLNSSFNYSNDWQQLLQISIGLGDIKLGQSIHGFLVKSGYKEDAFEGNNLINLYIKFDRLTDARRVFDEMLVRNIVTWTSLINGYSQINDTETVFQIAHQMYQFEEEFNERTCAVILRSCKTPKDQILGEQIHGYVIKSGFEENVFVSTSLISFYSKSGYLAAGETVFKNLHYKDLRCFNTMISEFGKAGNVEKAIQVFLCFLNSDLEPSDYTCTSMISACSGYTSMEEGRQLHGFAIKYGLVRENSVGNSLITMYGNHGIVEHAMNIFKGISEPNLISWTALLSGYVRNGCSERALTGFLYMLAHGMCFDSSCFATWLDGCSECRSFEMGAQIHGLLMKLGYISDMNVATSLIDLYAKWGNLQSAKVVFNMLSDRTTAAFNAILAGFTGYEEHAMILFNQLRQEGTTPDAITFSRLLCLCADQACLSTGKSLHGYTIKTGFEADVTVSNAIITMYAKCGTIEDSHRMFNGMTSHDLISWNAIISAYSLHGLGREALSLFEEMKTKQLFPDGVTVLAVLQACSYSGLWESGCHLFDEMESRYGIQPLIEHFACMVDLLGRAGHLLDAVSLIKKSPFIDSPLLWRTLVHVCKVHGDLKVGKIASKYLLDLAPKEAGSYILVSNFYAGEGMFDEAAKVRTFMNDMKLSKEAGCSWIEIDNKFHWFMAGEKDHPDSAEIYKQLNLLRNEMNGNLMFE